MDKAEIATRVINNLGGTKRASELLHTSTQRISNWKRTGFPPLIDLLMKIAFPNAHKK